MVEGRQGTCAQLSHRRSETIDHTPYTARKPGCSHTASARTAEHLCRARPDLLLNSFQQTRQEIDGGEGPASRSSTAQHSCLHSARSPVSSYQLQTPASAFQPVLGVSSGGKVHGLAVIAETSQKADALGGGSLAFWPRDQITEGACCEQGQTGKIHHPIAFSAQGW